MIDLKKRRKRMLKRNHLIENACRCTTLEENMLSCKLRRHWFSRLIFCKTVHLDVSRPKDQVHSRFESYMYIYEVHLRVYLG